MAGFGLVRQHTVRYGFYFDKRQGLVGHDPAVFGVAAFGRVWRGFLFKNNSAWYGNTRRGYLLLFRLIQGIENDPN